MYGHIIGDSSACAIVVVSAAANLVISATAANVIPGDVAFIECDGVNYYVSAISGGADVGWSSS